MVRFTLASLVLTGIPLTAAAQPGRLPLAPGVHQGSSIGPGTQFLPQSHSRLPLAPGVYQRSSIGPGTQFLPQPTSRFNSGASWINPYAGRPTGGYQFFPRPYYFGYSYGLDYEYIEQPGYDEPVYPVVGPVVRPARPEPAVVLANEFPATLVVQFPAAADVWLNGRAVSGAAADERVLTSPVLKPGESYAFAVKARWAAGGKTYEANRTVTLGGGDRSRLIVVSGAEVK
ncbi:hypothetical protein R5W24_004990 [Gemmata sp. JC717]|uniref:hypothetical protein n=1 Tax=Gemmata algarum TaxID=2975278 RepID=UPI0021BB48E8|nr:hypothetical protein [Gemmata algarum]MDY3555844.1 hypothetical protein [Gemmata algarum]